MKKLITIILILVIFTQSTTKGYKSGEAINAKADTLRPIAAKISGQDLPAKETDPVDATRSSADQIAGIKELVENGFFNTAEMLLKDLESSSMAEQGTVMESIESGKKAVRASLKAADSIPEAEKFDFYLRVLSDAIASDNEENEHTALEYFEYILFDTSEDIIDISVRLLERLDFKSKYPSQAITNIGIMCLLAKLPNEDMALDVARRVVMFMKYKGAFEELIRIYGRNFFESIPDALMYQEAAPRPLEDDLTTTQKARDSIGQYLREISQYPRLTRVGEIVLGVIVDEASQEKLVNANLRLAFYWAKVYSFSSRDISLDFVQQANLGLMTAVKKWDPTKDVKFVTYATWSIKQSIRHYIGNTGVAIRVPIYLQNRIKKFKDRCSEAGIDPLSKTISLRMIADAIGMELKEVRRLRNAMLVIISLDKPYEGRDPVRERDSTLMAELSADDEDIQESEYIETLSNIILGLRCILGTKWRGKNLRRNMQIFRLRVLPILLGDVLPVQPLNQMDREMGLGRGTSRLVRLDILDALGQVVKQMGIDIHDMRDLISFAGNRWTPEELETILYREVERKEVSVAAVMEVQRESLTSKPAVDIAIMAAA